MDDKIYTCLWYASEGETAARFYIDLFRDGAIGRVFHWPSGPNQGKVLTVEFTLFGRRFMALNGDGDAPYSHAMSVVVECEDQAEIDRYWDALRADGGAEIECGWVKDRWGVHWQIIPREMIAWHTGPNGAATMAAMMTMKKLDVAALKAAAGE